MIFNLTRVQIASLKLFCTCFFVAILLSQTAVRAQDMTELEINQLANSTSFSAVVRSVPLEMALERVVAETGINLLYSSELVDGKDAYCIAYDEPIPALLRCLLSQSKLDFYQTSSGTFVLIENPRQKPNYGQIAGIVIDADTGEPLPFANILIADASAGTAANEAGMFSFAKLLPGSYLVESSYVGYMTGQDSVWVEPGSGTQARIRLQTRPIVSDPIIVNGLLQRLPSRALGEVDNEASEFEAPGGLSSSDITRSVQQFLGINLQSPLADLHIQGSESGEHLMTLDGVRIFNPVSLGRMLGAFSPLSIGRLRVHKAGFGARYGSQLSGIVATDHQLVSRENRILSGTLDPLSTNLKVNLHEEYQGGRSLSLMAATRLGNWGLYQAPQLNSILEDWAQVDQPLTSQILNTGTLRSSYESVSNESSIGFSDIHLAGRIGINPYQRLYFSGYVGKNNIDTRLKAVGELATTDSSRFLDTRDIYDWNNTAGQIRHEWLLGSRAIGMLRVRASRHSLDHTYILADSVFSRNNPNLNNIVLDNFSEISALDENTITEVAIDGTFDYSISSTNHIAVGFEANRLSNRVSLQSSFFQPVEVPYDGWTFSGFVEEKINLGIGYQIELGTRLTHVDIRKETYLEPRVAIRMDHSKSGFAGRLAAGLYRQFLNEFDLSSVGPSELVPALRFWYPVDETLAPPKSYHLASEMLWMPAPGWTTTFELYYKWQPRVLTLNYPVLLGVVGVIPENGARHAHYIEASKGEAYGAGFRIQREAKKSISSIAYSYNQANRTYPSRFDGASVPVSWNDPHRLTMSSDLLLNDDFTLRVRWFGIWGRTWGFRQAYYDWLNAHAGTLAFPPFNLNRPQDHKLPVMHQLDAGISYNSLVKNARVQFRADLVNVLNRRNVVDWSISNNVQDNALFTQVPRTLPGIQAVFSVKVEI